MSQYDIFITPRAWRELKMLPGNMRQRLRREIESLAATPRPATSKALEVPVLEEEEAQSFELRRLRIDRWRVSIPLSLRTTSLTFSRYRNVRRMIMET